MNSPQACAVVMSIHNINNMLTAVAVVIIAIALSSCMRDNDHDGTVRNDLPLEQLRDGDLLFRCGIGTQSQVVTKLDTADGTYSHVGIAVFDHGKWRVVHAVPGESNDGVDRVKVDAVDTFFMTSRAVHGAAMRMPCSPAAARIATHRALELARQGIPFDSHYNWSNHNELYCTELVQLAYEKAGIDLAQGRSTSIALPFHHGNIVFPSDIARNDSLQLVFKF